MSPIKTWRAAFVLVAIVITCGLTPFINPFGMEMINTWQRIVGSKVLKEVVAEHKPLEPLKPLGLTIIGFGAFYLFLLVGTLPKLPRVSWVIPLVWLVLSFQSIRQGPLFAITAAVAIVDLWPHTLWYRLLKKNGDGSLAPEPEPEPHRALPGLVPMLVPALAVAAAFYLQVNRIEAPLIGHGWARLDPEMVPVDLNEEVAAYAASVPPGTPIFNDANLGGYLIYHAPSLKIFMDDRCELYGDPWIRNYSDTLGLPPEQLGPVFEDWEKRYQFQRAIVITQPETPSIEQYLLSSPKWREVARGKRAVMFERIQ